jgi:hypothetical protein
MGSVSDNKAAVWSCFKNMLLENVVHISVHSWGRLAPKAFSRDLELLGSQGLVSGNQIGRRSSLQSNKKWEWCNDDLYSISICMRKQRDNVWKPPFPITNLKSMSVVISKHTCTNACSIVQGAANESALILQRSLKRVIITWMPSVLVCFQLNEF